jgi:xanthine/uracil/vitamin C permease (AzgA family)
LAWAESWQAAFALGLALLLANLPFLLLARGPHQGLAMLAAYAVFLLCGWGLEAQLASPWRQGWSFYLITGLFFVVLGFPGWVWRHLRAPRARSGVTNFEE